MPRRFLLVDRDGTLIVEKNYLCDPEGVEVIPGVPDALKRFQDAGWGIAVVTNQAGVGRGYYTLEQMHSVNKRVEEILSRHDVTICAFYACPHTPDAGCNCRKPNPGMIHQAVLDFQFDPKDAIVVGDKACDVQLGLGVGAKAVLVRTGYGHEEEKLPDLRPNLVINSLADLLPSSFDLAPSGATSQNSQSGI